ncbi:MAG TPA: rhodanese-like domain-containing protein [Thermodesulfobacteriota bacterium]|nr:rhodanese-like domain-containing protein [Thermodesulfobacteriota bacterium]
MARGIRAEDFNELNEVALFMGQLFEKYRTMETGDLRALIDKGERFLLIDARGPGEFAGGHICGAVNIPVECVERDISGLADTEGLVVVYAGDSLSAQSVVAVDKLHTLGYDKVLRYAGGLKEWKKAGLCVEGLNKAA